MISCSHLFRFFLQSVTNLSMTSASRDQIPFSTPAPLTRSPFDVCLWQCSISFRSHKEQTEGWQQIHRGKQREYGLKTAERKGRRVKYLFTESTITAVLCIVKNLWCDSCQYYVIFTYLLNHHTKEPKCSQGSCCWSWLVLYLTSHVRMVV